MKNCLKLTMIGLLSAVTMVWVAPVTPTGANRADVSV